MPKLLFSEFGSSNKDTWKKQAEKELKEKYSEATAWRISDHLISEAYYTAEDVNDNQRTAFQQCQKKHAGWLNMPEIRFDTSPLTRNAIRSALTSGADAIILDLHENDLIGSALPETLHFLTEEPSQVFFKTEISSKDLFQEISGKANYLLKGGIYNDPLANWMRTGNSFHEAVSAVCLTLGKTREMKNFRPLMIESHVYHNAGADAVQELAFLMASTAFYLDQLTDAGITPADALNGFFYSVSIGPDYLTEIAKLRALRFLYRKMSRAYQVPDALCQVFIHARTSSFYHAAQSAHNNIIRSASEAMSAVLGGCDALTVQPFDHTFSETSLFSERIARNVSLLLAHESHFDSVADPAAGSYQLEIMSRQIAVAAWDLFLQTEEKGGLLPCFEEGFIQSEIEKTWQKKAADLHQGKVMVGVNKYQTSEGSGQSFSKVLFENVNSRFHALPVRNLSAAFF